MNLPNDCENVILTYIGTVYVPDKYYGKFIKEKVIRWAIYFKSTGFYNGKDEWIDTPNGYFSVPKDWGYFNGVLLPKGFNIYDRVLTENIIKWEYVKQKLEEL